MAPPYRKSCYSCIKAKRRCSLEAPRCVRCEKKGFVCDYKGRAHGAEQAAPVPRTDSIPATNEDFTGIFDQYISQENFLFDRNDPLGNVSELYLDGSDTIGLVADPAPIVGSCGFTVGAVSPIHNMSLEDTSTGRNTTSGDTLTPNNGTPEDGSSPGSPQGSELAHMDLVWVKARTHDPAACADSVPLILTPEEEFVLTSDTRRPRVKFVCRMLQRLPRTLVETGQNAFVHRQLCLAYPTAWMDDAMSCCALYTARNPRNEEMVFNDLRRKAKKLVEESSHITHADHMISLQCLLLYQIIRLFDGDIRLRAEAERDLQVMENWTECLVRRTQNIGPSTFDDILPNLSKTTIECWNGWIFQESSRRTVLTSFMIQAVYTYLRDGLDKASAKIQKLSFTAREALWDAVSHAHWKRVIVEKRRYQLKIADWDEQMIGVEPDDLGDLGIMVLASLKDIDHTCDFLGERRAQKYNLDMKSLIENPV